MPRCGRLGGRLFIMTAKGLFMLMSSSMGSPESGFVYGAGVAVGSGVGSALALGTASASGSGRVDGFVPQAARAKTITRASTAEKIRFILTPHRVYAQRSRRLPHIILFAGAVVKSGAKCYNRNTRRLQMQFRWT